MWVIPGMNISQSCLLLSIKPSLKGKCIVIKWKTVLYREEIFRWDLSPSHMLSHASVKGASSRYGHCVCKNARIDHGSRPTSTFFHHLLLFSQPPQSMRWLQNTKSFFWTSSSTDNLRNSQRSDVYVMPWRSSYVLPPFKVITSCQGSPLCR